MRLLLAALALAAAPLAGSANADPGVCVTIINSKGLVTTVCEGGQSNEAVCWVNDPGFEYRPVPYVKACVSL